MIKSDKLEVKMEIEITKMSSRGQVVIPQQVRDKLNVGEGSAFAVLGSDNTIILKKIEMPDKEQLIKDLEKVAKEGRKKAEKLGIKESDVPNLVHRFRAGKKAKK